LINRATTFTALSALLVCLSIGGVFLDALWGSNLTTPVAWIFGASLLALILGPPTSCGRSTWRRRRCGSACARCVAAPAPVAGACFVQLPASIGMMCSKSPT